MGKLGDCHSNENGVKPGANVSWFKTHNATGLRDGHPNTSLRNFGNVIGIVAINTDLAFNFPLKE